MLIAFLIFVPVLDACAGPLDDLAKPRGYQSHRISSYDRAGGNGDGGQGNPLKVGETRTLADIKGPGEICHIWFTFAQFDKDTLGNLILRMYWDGEKTPSVEAPIGAFFGLGHGKEYSFDSVPFSVLNNRGVNCFFPMPFKRSARVTIENQSDQQLWALYYYINYKSFDSPRPDDLCFHAQYRQAKPELSRDNYLALDAKGKGHYVGMFYYIRSNSGGWWGEGDDMICIDGNPEHVLYGTGMEDYFGGAWGMKPGQSFARFGSPLFEVYMTGDGNENTAYRWHLEDAIAFDKSISVTHEHGSNNDRNDDFFSVAFWYQTEPHAPFHALPSKFERLSYADKKKALLDAKKYSEYRAMVSDFVQRALDPEARLASLLDLSRSFVSEGDNDGARDTLVRLLGPIPVQGWADRIRKTAEELGLPPIGIPDSDFWVVNCGDGRAVLDAKAGSNCYRTDKANHSPFIYMKSRVPDLRNTEKDLVLEIEFFGQAGVRAEYNAVVEGAPVSYRAVSTPGAQGSSGWRTVRIDLPAARFSGSQNCEADLRLSSLEGDLYVRKVSVSVK